LTTRVVLEPGKTRESRLAIPLWSGGRILSRPRRDPRPNVVLISLDTLRADYVGAYGSGLETTPNLDRLAEEGVLFENAVAPYPSTTASHMSLLTGTYPDVHDVLGPTRVLSKELATLAEILSGHGYQTAAVTEDGMISARSGFARGFGFYREFKHWDPATTDGHVRAVVTEALAWLDRHPGERFFLFVHTYQVHGPYAPPDEFRVFAVDVEASAANDAEIRRKMERERAAYAGEVLYTDHEIGRFLSGLADRGLADETIVVVTSDHGEALGEHGAFGHGWFLIEEVLSVPLLLRAPDAIPEGLRVSSPVSLVDVSPTILELVGLPSPKDAQGVSLVPLIADPEAAAYHDRVVYSQRGRGAATSFGMRRGDRKWLFRDEKEPEVFDLEADPGEVRPLADDALLGEGRRFLDEFLERNRAARSRLAASASAPLDEETLEKLRRLGYVD
jgi:arylsulfatase A-like enzyme